MHLEPIKAHHESLLNSWRRERGIHEFPLSSCPPTGMIAFNKENKPLAAAFLFLTNSPLCFVDWVIADPQSDKMERREAIKLLISRLYEEGKSVGYRVGYALVEKQSIKDVLGELGFSEDVHSMTGYIKGL